MLQRYTTGSWVISNLNEMFLQYIPENVTVEDFNTGVEITLDQLNDWTQRQFGNSAGVRKSTY